MAKLTRLAMVDLVAGQSADVRYGNYMQGQSFARGYNLIEHANVIDQLFDKTGSIELLISAEQVKYELKRGSR